VTFHATKVAARLVSPFGRHCHPRHVIPSEHRERGIYDTDSRCGWEDPYGRLTASG